MSQTSHVRHCRLWEATRQDTLRKAGIGHLGRNSRDIARRLKRACKDCGGLGWVAPDGDDLEDVRCACNPGSRNPFADLGDLDA